MSKHHKKRGPIPGSFPSWLATFDVGDVRWIECESQDQYASFGARARQHKRLPATMRHYRFKIHAYTAISQYRGTDIRLVARIERTQ